MIQFSINTERLLLVLILGVLLFNGLTKRCEPLQTKQDTKLGITRDTLWQQKTDTLKINTVHYKTVYVNPEDVAEVIRDTVTTIPPDAFETARVYEDTLRTEDIDIYSYSLTEGALLDSKLSYTLKVPREITITKTVEVPGQPRSGLFLFGELGGNAEVLDNLSVGLQYQRKNKWFGSYRYNLVGPNGGTHNVGVGVKLFK